MSTAQNRQWRESYSVSANRLLFLDQNGQRPSPSPLDVGSYKIQGSFFKERIFFGFGQENFDGVTLLIGYGKAQRSPEPRATNRFEPEYTVNNLGCNI
ncbi:hypothetical protein [Paracoccus sediminilitoris]|uniref:hypothetical protein n=1 Tax=Paracoccus sediminilitoris TaxID=2202419 RepID=UPI00272AA481|nr:hypothetical protein [Paracoccus sediminilitoris]